MTALTRGHDFFYEFMGFNRLADITVMSARVVDMDRTDPHSFS
jgi:hypothetical protein